MASPGAESVGRAILERGVADGIFPQAVAEVGNRHRAIWRDSVGTDLNTIFDLASLTKPLATTHLLLDLAARGALSLSDPVSRYFPEWRAADRADVTLRDLLEHASGLPPRLLESPPASRREFEHEICRTPLEYEPRTRSVYSDLDFILLGFVIADVADSPLDALFEAMAAVADALSDAQDRSAAEAWMGFRVPDADLVRTAPTRPLPDDCRRGRTLVGEVHDAYASLLGGAAGHAGLFGTAGGVGLIARILLRSLRAEGGYPPPFSREWVETAVRRSTVTGSSRALGWDTMLPTSSCGTRMSPSAFGHVGFTGTSLWIDPERDRYFVLLTNRAYTNAGKEAMQQVRRDFHDALAPL